MKRKKKIILLICLIAIILIVFHIPAKWIFDESNSVCIHKRLFGIGCPLCGMTRAVYDVVHFNFARAMNENFNVFTFVVTIICWMIYYFYPSPSTRKLSIVMLLVSLAGFVIVYALRLGGIY